MSFCITTKSTSTKYAWVIDVPLENFRTNSLPVVADVASLLKLSIFPSVFIFKPFLDPGTWNCDDCADTSKSTWGSLVLTPILPEPEKYNKEVSVLLLLTYCIEDVPTPIIIDEGSFESNSIEICRWTY